ncbi:MAG TPA: helix-turn-helix domain-containing protein [Actinomycetaceae bacterium]|nr:helix-turn-helix domain-containing protein [Actinomycetaceae bacterium]
MSSTTVGATPTRDRILDLVITDGPVSAGELAGALDLTSAAIRRHIAALEAEELITAHETVGPTTPRRGRPARVYVATPAGQARLSNAYSDIARETLRYIEANLGAEALEDFIESSYGGMFSRYEPLIEKAGPDPTARAEALAEVLTAEGFAATVRGVGDGFALQLCQGHCPVVRLAMEFPQFCAVETRIIGELLDLHVQRLATLADGEHVCTTNIPLTVRPTKGQA